MRIISSLSTIILCASLLAGCGHFKKQEFYAAYGPSGNVVYYRITTKGYGSLGKVDYRSGWYDERAVDELFGDVSRSAPDPKVTINKARQEALAGLATQYSEAATKGDTAKMQTTKATMAVVYSDLALLAPADASPEDAFMNYSGKKFVMVLANNPDEILKMIGDSIKKDKIVQAVSAYAKNTADQASSAALDAVGAAKKKADEALKDLEPAKPLVDAAETAPQLRAQIQYLKALTAP